MFDFAWSEIALIGVVALIAIGPKDMPVAIKAVAEMIKKARRMAGEFQTHVDEMVREANLHDVRDQFNDLRRMDIKGKILKAVDDDGSLRKTFSENPMDFSPPPPVVPVADSAPQTALADTVVAERDLHSIPGFDPAPVPEVPAFVPPAFATPAFVPASFLSPAFSPAPFPSDAASSPSAAPAFAAPAFVPPAFMPPADAAAQTQHA